MGLSESATSLVWLAGPVSGLIAQPLIGQLSFIKPVTDDDGFFLLTSGWDSGAISDASTSKYRRRMWIVGATVTISFGLFALSHPWCLDRSIDASAQYL